MSKLKQVRNHTTPRHTTASPSFLRRSPLPPVTATALLCPAPPLLMHVSSAIFYVIKMSVLVTNGRECHFLALDYNLEFFCVRAAVCRAGLGWADSGVGAAVFV